MIVPGVMAAEEAREVIDNLSDLLKQIYEKLHVPGLCDRRRCLVLASLLRAQSLTRSILHLSEIVAVEEMWSLTRTLTEVVINTTYLQVADEIEVERFEKFDFMHVANQTGKLRKHLTYPNPQEPGVEAAIARIAAEARAATGRKDTDKNWSAYGLMQRAELADERTKHPVFKTLTLTGGPYGHSAIHGTMFTYGWFMSGLNREHDVPDSDRMEALRVVLHATSFILTTHASVLNILFKLGFGVKLSEAAREGLIRMMPLAEAKT